MKEFTSTQNGNFNLDLAGIDYEILVQNQKIRSGNEQYINATEILKTYNANPKQDLFWSKKRLDLWFKSHRTKEIVEKFMSTPGGSKAYYIYGAGRGKSTWIHKDLFLHLMIWLDAEHEIAVVKFINHITDKFSQAGEIRNLERSRYKQVTDDLKPLYALCLKEGTTQPEEAFYTTVNQKLHNIASGSALKRGGMDHDSLDLTVTRNISVLRDCLPEWIEQALEQTETARKARTRLYEIIASKEVIKKDGQIIVRSS
jgi:hypothetical protein